MGYNEEYLVVSRHIPMMNTLGLINFEASMGIATDNMPLQT
jgi:hypothetical protein